METNQLNQKCIFNEETKEKIYNLYRGSNLEVLEYLKKNIIMGSINYTILQ